MHLRATIFLEQSFCRACGVSPSAMMVLIQDMQFASRDNLVPCRDLLKKVDELNAKLKDAAKEKADLGVKTLDCSLLVSKV